MSRQIKRAEFLVGPVILGGGVLFMGGLAAKLFLEGRTYPATGLTIVTLCFLFFWILTLIPASKTPEKTKPSRKPISDESGNEELACVMETKDPVSLNAAQAALLEVGVEVFVLGRQGETMLSFLPDMISRLMVPASQSVLPKKILDEMEEL